MSIDLFYCGKNVFTHMIEKDLLHHHCMRKKIFTVTYTWILPDYTHAKEFVKFLK